MSIRRTAVGPLALVVALASCGRGSDTDGATTVEGTVIAVDGTLAEVSSFTMRLSDGGNLTFVPAEGVLFHGSAPMNHLRDHLASGTTVRVGYIVLADGTLSAVLVEDG